MIIDVDALAQEMLDAADSGTPVPLLTERYPGICWDDARAVARGADDLRRARGESQIGWKLGWTSAVMREALGVASPNWGTLWESQVLDSSVNAPGFIHPKVEPELVWRAPLSLKSETALEGKTVTADDVVSANGDWALGIEVVDPRFASYDFDLLDNTSDNSSSAGIRMGQFEPLGSDPAAVKVRFSSPAESREGLASEAMGSPAEAVAWLVRSLAGEGLSLNAGDIVFTGGLTRPFDAQPGCTYRLGSTAFSQGVTLEFT